MKTYTPPKAPESDETLEMVAMCGFDSAIIGYAEVWDSTGMQVGRLVYDAEKMADVLLEQGCSNRAEAYEYIEYNCCGAYVGPATPIIVWPCGEEVKCPH